MVSLVARSATVGFPEHTTALILIRKGVWVPRTYVRVFMSKVNGICSVSILILFHSYSFS